MIGSRAEVLFCDADAAKAYADAHPNGLLVEKDGRKTYVLVDLAKDVDIVSSQLRTQLDCGATRCVRAIGADEDWSMAALQKVAESKCRKVEKIIDSCSPNEAGTLLSV